MADVTDAPKAAARGGKNALSKIPKWGWVAGGGVTLFVIYKYRKSNQVATPAPDPNATAPADQGLTSQAFVPATLGGGAASGFSGGSGVTQDPTAQTQQPTAPGLDLQGLGTFISALYPNGIPAGGSQPIQTQTGGGAPSSPAPPGVVAAPPPAAPPEVAPPIFSPPAAPVPVPVPNVPVAVASTPQPASGPAAPPPCPASHPHRSARGCYRIGCNSNHHVCHYYTNGTVECLQTRC